MCRAKAKQGSVGGQGVADSGEHRHKASVLRGMWGFEGLILGGKGGDFHRLPSPNSQVVKFDYPSSYTSAIRSAYESSPPCRKYSTSIGIGGQLRLSGELGGPE